MGISPLKGIKGVFLKTNVFFCPQITSSTNGLIFVYICLTSTKARDSENKLNSSLCVLALATDCYNHWAFVVVGGLDVVVRA